jgi:hypothetical protein
VTAVRRPVVATGLVLLMAAPTVVPQTVLAMALGDLSRYFDAAARLIATAVAGLDTADSRELSPDQRAAATAELRNISDSIVFLRVEQKMLIVDLSEYADTVRKRGTVSDSDVKMWRAILSSIAQVSDIVRDLLTLVEQSQWLAVAVSAEDRLALAEVLEARVSLLTRLRGLPTPGTPDELDQLERMNGRYINLHQSLGALNVALTRAADRLAVN